MSAATAGREPAVLGGKLRLSVVTPETTVHDGPVDVVVVPGHDGEVAFYPGHAAFVGLLGVGELRFHASEGGTKHFFLAGGVAQVVDDRVSVLAETVLPVASLSAEKAQQDLAAAIASKAADPEAAAARERAIQAARGQLRLARRSSGSSGAAAH